jgi:hypothetical protein
MFLPIVPLPLVTSDSAFFLRIGDPNLFQLPTRCGP